MKLLDCFLEPIALALRLSDEEVSQGVSAEEAAADFARLISRLDAVQQRDHHFHPDDFDTARFAVVVWIDETLLTSAWKGAAEWGHYSLQRKYYNTYSGGEEFYDRLREALHIAEARAEGGSVAAAPEEGASPGGEPDTELADVHQVLEVFAACLFMGFKGCYHTDAQQPELRTLMFRILAVSSVDSVSVQSLFAEVPKADGSGQVRARVWSRSVFLMQAISLIVTIMIYFFYQHDLSVMLEDWFRQGLG